MPETIALPRADWIHPSLPVLRWPAALPEVTPEAAEALFARNGWPPAWRWGIYDFHHFHSNTHEALAVVRSSARVILGGPKGEEVPMQPGDVVVLPAGTGHRLLEDRDGFLCVGAYPEGFSPDLIREAPDEAARRRIEAVPIPPSDPVEGEGGGWR